MTAWCCIFAFYLLFVDANMTKAETLLAQVEAQGFDRSRISGDSVRLGCSQCAAVAINGTACHETGCPNQTHECGECGGRIPRGERCDCMDGELRDGDEGGYGHA